MCSLFFTIIENHRFIFLVVIDCVRPRVSFCRGQPFSSVSKLRNPVNTKFLIYCVNLLHELPIQTSIGDMLNIFKIAFIDISMFFALSNFFLKTFAY